MKGPSFESPQEQWENFLLQGQLSVLSLVLVSTPPCVTRVACKRSWSFCQKCRGQITPKHMHPVALNEVTLKGRLASSFTFCLFKVVMHFKLIIIVQKSE